MAYKLIFNPFTADFDYVNDLSGYIPYSGATGNVNLNNKNLTNVNALGVNGIATLANGLLIEPFAGQATSTWIDMPITGPSGIGSGGAGVNAWLAYTYSSGQWFSDATAGDINYRNITGNLNFGNSEGNAAMTVSLGNVGIHTVAPSYNLHVNGTLGVTDASSTYPFLTVDPSTRHIAIGDESPYNLGTVVVVDDLDQFIQLRANSISMNAYGSGDVIEIDGVNYIVSIGDTNGSAGSTRLTVSDYDQLISANSNSGYQWVMTNGFFDISDNSTQLLRIATGGIVPTESGVYNSSNLVVASYDSDSFQYKYGGGNLIVDGGSGQVQTVGSIFIQTDIDLGSGGNLNLNNSNNIVFSTSSGSGQIGTAANQYLSFWGGTPTVRLGTGVSSATFVAGVGTPINTSSTFDGYTFGQAIKILRTIGIFA